MVLPDPIEIGEARCERWEVAGFWLVQCCCGNMCKLSEGEPLSPDPYAIPVCPECLQKAIDEKVDQR